MPRKFGLAALVGAGRMGRSVPLLLAAPVLVWITGCASSVEVRPPDSVGGMTLYATNAALDQGHFQVEPQVVEAEVGVGWRGCVLVKVDGVLRVPFWPDGAEVDAPSNLATVTLPSGLVIAQDSPTGGRFTADARIEGKDLPWELHSFEEMVTNTCGTGNLPILFEDASTFVVAE